LDNNSIGDKNDQIKQKNALPRKNASNALKQPLHQKKRNHSMRIMKSFIEKMLWINETGIILIGKKFEYI